MSMLHRYYALDHQKAELLNLAEKIGIEKVVEILKLLDKKQTQPAVLIQYLTAENLIDLQALEQRILVLEKKLGIEVGPHQRFKGRGAKITS